MGCSGLLDWDTGPARLADCVEIAVGAAWQVDAGSVAVTAARLVNLEVAVEDVAARPAAAHLFARADRLW